jgi:hypothetical protein
MSVSLGKAVDVASFAIRHLAAFAATVLAACALWTATYAGLFLWALVRNSELGGPFAYPAGLVFAAAAASILSFGVYFPATSIAERICRYKSLPRIAQLPISFAVALPICLAAVLGLHVLVGSRELDRDILIRSAWLLAVAMLPLVFYWFVVRLDSLVVSGFRRLAQRAFQPARLEVGRPGRHL